MVTINGTGFGALGLDWVNVGPYQSDDSDDYTIISVSSTQLSVVLPPEAASSSVLDVPVTVQTAGSPNQAPEVTLTSVPPSNTVDVAYAPTPSVSGVSTSNPYAAGPTSGGTPITLTGSGFTGADEVIFVDQKYGFESTQYSLNVVSNSEITQGDRDRSSGDVGQDGCSPGQDARERGHRIGSVAEEPGGDVHLRRLKSSAPRPLAGSPVGRTGKSRTTSLCQVGSRRGPSVTGRVLSWLRNALGTWAAGPAIAICG